MCSYILNRPPFDRCCCITVRCFFAIGAFEVEDFTLFADQGAFHVVNPEDLRREIKSLLGVAAYGLLPWRGGATLFRFIWRKCC